MNRALILIVVSVIIIIVSIVIIINNTLTRENNSKLKVITSVAPVTDMVRNIGCDKIELNGVIPEGMDSHTFEPTPSDAIMISNADLVIINGLNLEISFERIVESAREDNQYIHLLKLADNTITPQEWIFDFSFPKENGYPNPHLWLNVAYSIRYAELIRDKLIELDPINRDYYLKNGELYIERLRQLDEGIKLSIQTIPSQNRKLLTYHDSWPYFAERYGMKIIGAIQPSDFSEPTPQDIAMIIEEIREEKIPAIFASEVFPSKVIEQIAKEAGVKVVTTLADDILPGKAGDPNHTYIGMMIENMHNMIIPLGGNIDALDEVNVKSVCNE
ncbi:MAG: metal ABC transporter substrate-binding protein [Candidatus Nitrosocaldaceae archaeon]